ncbi:MAG TPA: hypothetical protein VN704_06390, partial [Verrucomicrobiae bacterium]|nr:hypothetical protein [Verrucomicrobiae bacterium]
MTIEKIEKDSLENAGNSINTISKVPFDKTEKSYVINNALDFEENVIHQILQSLPVESQITCAKLEGTNIALYTKNPEFSLT